jgi:type III secretion system YscD/HrpQ family protein
MRVWNIADLSLTAKHILGSLGINHVNVSSSESGKLTVSGYVVNKSNWQQVRQTLMRDVPGVEMIDDRQIYSLEQIVGLIKTRINDNVLAQWLSVETYADTIKVTGVLPNDQSVVWLQSLEDFRQELGFSVDINDQVTDAQNQEINLPVKSISIGEVSYLTLKDNSKYIQGSVISDGFTLQAIHADHIVISKNNIKYNYYIGATHE